MFERFTEEARETVVLAQEEARHFNHDYVGTEHLLLGLLRLDEATAAQALASLDVTVNRARDQVASIIGYGEEGTDPQVPFTPRSKKVFELGLRESMQLGHSHIGTEHILLGLVRESEGVAALVLSNLGVEADEVRREVIRRLGDGCPADARSLLFRGRVLAFEVQVRFGSLGESVLPQTPQPASVELDYTYSAQENGDVLLGTVDPSDLREGVTTVLAGEEFVLPEAGLVRAGEYVLEEFETVREVTVSVTVPRAPDPGRSPGVRLSGTFRR
jgi:dihydroneopterin aldolase